MSLIILFALVVLGIHTAKVIEKAGLRQFAKAILLTNTSGWIAYSFNLKGIGFLLVLISVCLMLASTVIMQKHKIGPWEPHSSNEKDKQ